MILDVLPNKLLPSSTRNNLIMALGNLAADSPLIKDQIIMKNGIDVLTTVFYTLEDRRSCENCAWAISNLDRRSNNNRQIS